MSKDVLEIFDSKDIESIKALIDKLEKSSFDYLKLEGDGFKIVIGKKGMEEVTEQSAPVTEARAKVVAAPEVKQPPAGIGEKVVKAPEFSAPPAETVPEQTGVTVIKSPSYGLFYSQPEPGSPPYVKLGDTVKAGQTLGLVEIMKTFTAITSTVDGEIVQIHVKNEAILEPDQPLFSIRLK